MYANKSLLDIFDHNSDMMCESEYASRTKWPFCIMEFTYLWYIQSTSYKELFVWAILTTEINLIMVGHPHTNDGVILIEHDH